MKIGVIKRHYFANRTVYASPPVDGSASATD
jgi:hypothetical protein